MERIEIVLDMLGTIRRLEKQLLSEPDPRLRDEIAITLDVLNPSFDREMAKLSAELKKPV